MFEGVYVRHRNELLTHTVGIIYYSYFFKVHSSMSLKPQIMRYEDLQPNIMFVLTAAVSEESFGKELTHVQNIILRCDQPSDEASACRPYINSDLLTLCRHLSREGSKNSCLALHDLALELIARHL